MLALAPELFNGAYSGTKAFVLNLSQSLQQEVAGQGVRVQAVLPGATRTEIWERAGVDVASFPPEMLMGVEEMVDAALAGLDLGEAVTIPSLPDLADWERFTPRGWRWGPTCRAPSRRPLGARPRKARARRREPRHEREPLRGRRAAASAAPLAMNPRTRLLLHGAHPADAAAAGLAEHPGHAGAGLDRADRDLVGLAPRHRRAGRHGAGLPGFMMMQMLSGGAIGGGIASAIARALGGGRREDADALVLHAVVINRPLGLAFSALVLGFGPQLYRALGGEGGSLEAALHYSNVVFAGNALVWLMNALASVIRGTGNMMLPSLAVCLGVVLLVPLSPLLIFGLGPGARRSASPAPGSRWCRPRR